VYVIFFRPAVGLNAVHHERPWAFWHRPFSTKGKFLATLTSQRRTFRTLARYQRSLMCSVIVPAFAAPLVSRIRASM
jgi:hypothetical protein